MKTEAQEASGHPAGNMANPSSRTEPPAAAQCPSSASSASRAPGPVVTPQGRHSGCWSLLRHVALALLGCSVRRHGSVGTPGKTRGGLPASCSARCAPGKGLGAGDAKSTHRAQEVTGHQAARCSQQPAWWAGAECELRSQVLRGHGRSPLPPPALEPQDGPCLSPTPTRHSPTLQAQGGRPCCSRAPRRCFSITQSQPQSPHLQNGLTLLPASALLWPHLPFPGQLCLPSP